MMKRILALLFGLCLPSLLLRAEIPAPPPAGEIWEGFRYSDEAAVRDAFRPMAGSLPAEYAPGYVKLPLNFKGTTHMRASWDIRFEIDMTDVGGIEFDFYTDDMTSCCQMMLFLMGRNDEEGFYVTTISMDKENGWRHFAIRKSDWQREGKKQLPWKDVRALRFSVWRFQDTRDATAAIAGLRVNRMKPDAVLITADSCVRPGNRENAGYTTYAMNLHRSLEQIGIECQTVSDLQAKAFDLSRTSVVILPYNPSLPPGLEEHLRSFIERGGKLLVCHTLPESVCHLLGMRKDKWLQSSTDHFTGYQATGTPLPGQPAFAGHFTKCAIVGHPTGLGQVFATWKESDGTVTQLPAAVATPAGVFLGYVWNGGNAELHRFLFAIMAHLTPGRWRAAAQKALDDVGRHADYRNYADLKARFPKDAPPAAREALTAAERLHQEGVAHCGRGEWQKAMESAGKAREQALRAVCALHRPRPGEFRGVTVHNAFGIDKMSWDEAIRTLAEHGFNAVIPNFCWGGSAYYPSEVLPVQPLVQSRGDQVRQCLDACRKYGVQCHLWKVNWNMGNGRHVDQAFAKRMYEEGRTQVTFDGKEEKLWLCPSHPLNLKLEVDAMLEVVRKYPELDGMMFDYIRYGNSNVCFCAGCHERFEKYIGRRIGDWPAAVRANAALEEKWNQFRYENINALVKQVHDGAKAIRPQIQLSAALVGNDVHYRRGVGQDWEKWCREGWLDLACPMDYADHTTTFNAMVSYQKPRVGKAMFYPIIGLCCWKNPWDPLNLIDQIEASREQGVPGFIVFNYDIRLLHCLPYLKLGCTAK